MPASTRPSTPTELVACSICHKEIPLSTALTPQGAEYVEYFCGIECYKEFLDEAAQAPNPPERPSGTQK